MFRVFHILPLLGESITLKEENESDFEEGSLCIFSNVLVSMPVGMGFPEN
jgi:hypothetical protein